MEVRPVMKKENRYVNILKGIACIMVVLNHYHGIGQMGDILYAISHFGVPVFFLISGYYMYSANGDTFRKLPNKIRHIGNLILLHIGLYVFDFICQRIILQNNLIRKDVVINDLFSYFTVGAIASSVRWSTSLFGKGQWFLIALFEGYILFWISYKVRLGKFIEKYGFWLAGALLVFLIPVRVILAKNGVHQLFGVNISESFFVRNVWFDALPFMLIGLNIRTHNSRVHNYKLLPIVSIAALLISIVEMYLLKSVMCNNQISAVLYAGTIISVVTAFLWAVSNTKEMIHVLQKQLEYIGKSLSIIVYFIHVIVGTYLQNKLGGGASLVQAFFPAIVICVTLIVSDIIFRIYRRISTNEHFSYPRILVTAIVIVILILPVGTEWIMIGRTTGSEESISLNRVLHRGLESTIMVTAQNSQGITIDASEIPVMQFIGGGVKRNSLQGEEEYSYEVRYVNDQNVYISKTDNIGQIRIWVR